MTPADLTSCLCHTRLGQSRPRDADGRLGLPTPTPHPAHPPMRAGTHFPPIPNTIQEEDAQINLADSRELGSFVQTCGSRHLPGAQKCAKLTSPAISTRGPRLETPLPTRVSRGCLARLRLLVVMAQPCTRALGSSSSSYSPLLCSPKSLWSFSHPAADWPRTGISENL